MGLSRYLPRERREHKVYLALLKSVPGLEERLMNANSEEEIQSIAAMVCFPCSTDSIDSF